MSILKSEFRFFFLLLLHYFQSLVLFLIILANLQFFGVPQVEVSLGVDND